MTLRTEHVNRLSPMLLLVCLALVLVLVVQWHTRLRIEHSEVSRVGQPVPVDPSPPGENYSAPVLAAFSDILERPLFTEGRKPYVPAVAPAAAARPSPLRLQVEGVVLTPETRIVVVRDLGNRELLRLPEGSSFQGWVIESVHPGGARFINGEQRQEFVLDPLNNPFRTR